jgi:hypothetical protein
MSKEVMVAFEEYKKRSPTLAVSKSLLFLYFLNNKEVTN